MAFIVFSKKEQPLSLKEIALETVQGIVPFKFKEVFMINLNEKKLNLTIPHSNLFLVDWDGKQKVVKCAFNLLFF